MSCKTVKIKMKKCLDPAFLAYWRHSLVRTIHRKGWVTNVNILDWDSAFQFVMPENNRYEVNFLKSDFELVKTKK